MRTHKDLSSMANHLPESPSPNVVMNELEDLLVQAETLTSDLLAGLVQASENPDEGLTATLCQMLLLRGQLLENAQQLAKSQAQRLQGGERVYLHNKVQQLAVLQSRLGNALMDHQTSLRQAMKDNGEAQHSLKAYAPNVSQREENAYIGDA
jgi:hypothetical protein